MSDEKEELVEQLEGWFTQHVDEEYLKGNIGRKGRSDLIAFNRLNELVPGDRDIIVAAGHDAIWLEVGLNDLAGIATEEDVIFLLQHGVLYDKDTYSLRMHA